MATPANATSVQISHQQELIMPNLLKVTLDKSTNPWCLDIDQKGNANHVSQGQNTQTITWQLSGNAASGSFDAQNASMPGFAWVSAPPPSNSIFGNPELKRQ
jgi:hypothetical protein